MWVVFSDLNQEGSGYSRIMTELCNRLAEEHEVPLIAMGLGYKGEEHHNKFRIVPCRHVSHFVKQIGLMVQYNVPVHGVLVATDIPIQASIYNTMRQSGFNMPYIGFFPLESGPVAQKWAPALLGMNDRIVMSDHARLALDDAGIPSHFVPIGVSPEYVPLFDDDIIKGYREMMGVDEDTFMILTVADNQERKNLAAAYEMVSGFAVDIQERNQAGFVTKKDDLKKVQWVIVTRPDSPVGWDLNDLGMRLGIVDKVSIISRGIDDAQLLGLYQAADCFLLTSKAEGLAMPVLEAMATRTLVVASKVSAIEDHLSDFRGYLVGSDYDFTDPFGNGRRIMVSVDDGIDCLNIAHEYFSLKRYAKKNGEKADVEKWEKILDDAQIYVDQRSWDKAAAQFAKIIKEHSPDDGS